VADAAYPLACGGDHQRKLETSEKESVVMYGELETESPLERRKHARFGMLFATACILRQRCVSGITQSDLGQLQVGCFSRDLHML
jgi:hypothetical protein